MENNNPVTSPTNDDDKTVAILSYVTIIGWIIALIMHGNKKSELGAYHIRQGLGIMILAVATIIIRIPLFFIPFLGWFLGTCLSIGLLILWILGLISAINGTQKPIPLLGESFQKWFSSVGK